MEEQFAQRDPLLRTKLFIPPARPNRVSRPHLTRQLEEGLRLGCKLTLMSAPAGFGKTTLMSEWIHSGGGDALSPAVAWVSLDKGDNDPTRFWSYVLAALGAWQAGLGENALALLHSPQPPPIQVVLTTLINEIATLSHADAVHSPSYVLVLDDCHVIEAQSIHQGLVFLIDHLPPRVHLIVCSRADPPWPLARLRARGQLAELRIDDLRFTPKETATFLRDVMGLELSAGDVSALELRTEGWIAGLQLAALSLQGQKAERVTEFVGAFSGSHRYVLDYLLEEVLQRQPREVQTFLLQTSVLDQLSAQLCDAVVVRDASSPSDGQILLEELERANLFIVPLDDKRRWYRYHRLFGDLLRARLQQAHPEQIPDLHRRAAAWYEGNKLVPEAVGHALAAEDFVGAARLIEQSAEQMLWMRGQVATLLGWLDTLPEDHVRARPGLCLVHAWALFLNVQWDAVEARVRDAERALEQTSLPSGVKQSFLDQIAVMEAMLSNFRGDIPRTIELSLRALELVPEGNLLLRAALAGNLGGAYVASGDFAMAAEAFAEATRLYKVTGNAFVTLLASSYRAAMQVELGQLCKAHETFRWTLEWAAERNAQQSLGACLVHAWLGGLLYEWNDLDAAMHHLTTAVTLGEGQVDTSLGPGQQLLVDAYLTLARVRQARGNAAGALEMIHKAEQSAQEQFPAQLGQVAAARVRLSLGQNDVETAVRWARECGLAPDDELGHEHEYEHLTLARVLLAQGRLDEARELLDRLGQAAESRQCLGSVIESLALQALVFQAEGRADKAMTTLERALSLAEPEGYVRLFVDEGTPMAELLSAFRRQPSAVRGEYVATLLAAFQAEGPGGAEATPRRLQTATLFEPLTERELEVLGLIADGLSNREIAGALVIAVTTVKKHASNIYGKLGVTSRTQAAARARELDLR